MMMPVIILAMTVTPMGPHNFDRIGSSATRTLSVLNTLASLVLEWLLHIGSGEAIQFPSELATILKLSMFRLAYLSMLLSLWTMPS